MESKNDEINQSVDALPDFSRSSWNEHLKSLAYDIHLLQAFTPSDSL